MRLISRLFSYTVPYPGQAESWLIQVSITGAFGSQW
jgi:hypothetical protein